MTDSLSTPAPESPASESRLTRLKAKLLTTWRVPFLLFCLLLSCYGYFYNGGGGNQVARFNQTKAIVYRGQLNADGVGWISDDQIKMNGKTYSSKAPGNSLLGVPPFALFNGIAWMAGPKRPFWQNWAAHMTTIVSVGVPCALMGVAFYAMMIGLGLSAGGALLGTLALTLGTTFFPYATMYFGHSLAGAFSFLSFYCLWKAHTLRKSGQDPGRRVLYAGLFTAGAVVTEYPLAIAAIILSLYLVSTRPRMRELLDWAMGGAVGVVILLIYNTLTFGNPLALSYLNYAHSERNAFPVHAHGLGGVTAPKLSILKEILWGDVRGIVWFAPILVLVVPGLLYMLAKRRDLWREFLVIVLMIIGFLTFNAGYGDSIRYWGGANSAGPRHLIPALPYAGLAIALLLDAAPWLLGGLVLASVTTALMATAVMPQVPMLFGKPFEDFLVPYFLNGFLSMHRGGLVSGELVTRDSIAYTWGKLVGLPGSSALLPLLLLVVGLLWALLRELTRQGKVSPLKARAGIAVAGLYCALLIVVPVGYQRAHALAPTGPGARATYYTERECKGKPMRTDRILDLDLRYDDGDIRPYPGGMCADIVATLHVTAPGTYTFRSAGGAALLTIDAVELFGYVSDRRRMEATVELAAGEHTLRWRTDVPVITQRVFLQVKTPESGQFINLDSRNISTPEKP